ncbi:MAG: hypothetical protein A4E45_01168 [Methanosaeta sp. PtaB.Bin039]|nr:MAG: hypothetical protein A4E45_01168 [Methanosaeta sp. PtaB.Bin039]HOT06174.1 hypothetical protein [Methanotrichaceae archaeon]HQF15517.1 hypothetical protein [Methanotrichaceae archaeon]HQI90252.1 hypothetical protein [Methanotrichaceae archaeon]HQJ27779.1 hypothetical protein [Methanotrichaceae archaeon]
MSCELRQDRAGSAGRSGLASLSGFLASPAFSALTVGVPFAVFKMLLGLLCLRMAAENASDFQAALGWLAIAWAAADLMMNLVRAAFSLAGKDSPIEFCLIAQAGRLAGRPRLFLALDTAVSFGIICLVLWSGWIRRLEGAEVYLWYAATTVNLMGFALLNLVLELMRRE